MAMFRVGDEVTILEGPGKGRTTTVAQVRMFATDRGYYLHGGDGLYRPSAVTLVRERTGGNPCLAGCDDRQHRATGTCDHCRGVCAHFDEES